MTLPVARPNLALCSGSSAATAELARRIGGLTLAPGALAALPPDMQRAIGDRCDAPGLWALAHLSGGWRRLVQDGPTAWHARLRQWLLPRARTAMQVDRLFASLSPHWLWRRCSSLSLPRRGLGAAAVVAIVRHCPQLQALDLQGNRLMALPCAVWQLQQLRQLNLARNQLQQLRLPAQAVPQLQCLDVSRNRLEALDCAAAQLPHLASLVLTGNCLTTDAVHLGRLAGLRRFEGRDNCFEAPPADLLGLGAAVSIDLRDQQAAGYPALER